MVFGHAQRQRVKKAMATKMPLRFHGSFSASSRLQSFLKRRQEYTIIFILLGSARPILLEALRYFAAKFCRASYDILLGNASFHRYFAWILLGIASFCRYFAWCNGFDSSIRVHTRTRRRSINGILVRTVNPRPEDRLRRRRPVVRHVPYSTLLKKEIVSPGWLALGSIFIRISIFCSHFASNFFSAGKSIFCSKNCSQNWSGTTPRNRSPLWLRGRKQARHWIFFMPKSTSLKDCWSGRGNLSIPLPSAARHHHTSWIGGQLSWESGSVPLTWWRERRNEKNKRCRRAHVLWPWRNVLPVFALLSVAQNK